MKFNWKANWEILLVLVIIVVGIVITTIAAIRNKDKQLLVVPDDTDFGQLLAPGGQVDPGASPALEQPRPAQSGASIGAPDDGGTSSTAPDVRNRPQYQSGPSHAAAKVAKPPSFGVQQALQPGPRTQSVRSFDNRLPKYDEGSDFNRQHPHSAHTNAGQLTRDQYEALGTETTPSSILSASGSPPNLNPMHLQHPFNSRGSSNRSSALPALVANDDSDSDDMIDDIHTTRSSQASSSNEHMVPNHPANLDPNQLSSLTLHAPYGSNTVGSNQMMRQHQPGPMLDLDELVSAYSRSPPSGSSNLTESMLNEFAVPSGVSNSSSQQSILANILAIHQHHQQQQQQQHSMQTSGDENIFNQNHQQVTHSPGSYHRSGSSHITTLLNDLLKLARPHHQSDATAGLTTQRPQTGILQQLRSLPGPLLTLIQGLSPSTLSSPDQAAMATFPNHDASESSQHYQRVMMSPTDLHSIMTRSQRSSSILPAFPAPKGTPQNWVPPTSGGDPSYHATQNSQADFVASNSAGFVRQSYSGAQSSPAPSATNHHVSEQYAPQHNHQSYQHQPVPRANENTDFAFLSNSNPNTGGELNQAGIQQRQSDSFASGVEQYGDQPGQVYVLQAADQSGSRTRAGSQSSAAEPNSYQRPVQVPQQSLDQINSNPNHIQTNSQYNKQRASAGHFNHAPAAQTLRGSNEVPLGYKPNHGQMLASNGVQQQLGQLQQRFEMAESKPKAVIMSGPTSTGAKQAAKTTQATGASRRKRSIEGASNRYRIDEEDEDTDSAPLSVVRPDGQPMKGVHLDGFTVVHSEASDAQLVSQSQRSPNHLELDDDLYVPPLRANQKSSAGDKSERAPNSKKHKHAKGSQSIETAGSGLMSRLLGMSSNTDELEDPELNEDMDEDSANERRKEALEDAEFGMSPDRRRNRKKVKKEQAGKGAGKKVSADARLGSGSNDSQSYARRQQQRSDIEFYGHPGEETRQLKYGILGSGNYEVVNGGIYPDADESTAAVNSVANYVRKPGALLSSLPKLLAEGASSSNGEPQSAGFMPGGRLSGAFMRGASANPEELIGLIPTEASKDLGARPLLEFIDAHGGAGQLFDANLLAQLGGSGSSSRTTHTEADAGSDEHDDQGEPKVKEKKQNRSKEHEEARLHSQSSSISSSRSKNGRGLNQFNSYQISPSKKVTIFSDQDLDSAPSEIRASPSRGTRKLGIA